jgi:hypothetical protein
MTVRYLVIGTWIDKQTGEPKVKMAKISEGQNKAGAAYGFADTEKAEMSDRIAKVGDIISFELTEV